MLCQPLLKILCLNNCSKLGLFFSLGGFIALCERATPRFAFKTQVNFFKAVFQAIGKCVTEANEYIDSHYRGRTLKRQIE